MTDHSPMPPADRDPEVARRARTGISLPVILASIVACLLGVAATFLASEIKLNEDLGRRIVDAGHKLTVPVLKTGMISLGEGAALIYDLVLGFAASQAFAEFVTRVAIAAAFPAVIVAGLWVRRRMVHRLGDRGREPETSAQIVLPRERNGGAPLGGATVLWTTTFVLFLVGALPALVDELSDGARWSDHGIGFIEAGLVVSGFMIAQDANVFDGRLRAFLLAQLRAFIAFITGRFSRAASPPSPASTVTSSTLATYRDTVVTHLGEAVRARPSISTPARATGVGQVAPLGPATLAHATKLARALDAASLAQWREAVGAFVGDGKGRNVTILDPLSKLHFAFLVEVMSIVQDQGRGVLVIAPQAMAEAHRADLVDAFSIHCRDITQSLWSDIGDGGGEAKDAATIETILFVTDRMLQRRMIEREAKAFAGVVERLGLIVVLDAHLFDLARLRLQLAILFRRAPATDIRVVAHAAAWRGMETELDKIFAATGRRSFRLRIARAASAPMEAIVVNNCTRARDALLDGFYPAFSQAAVTSSGRPFRSPPSRKEIEPLPLLARVALRPPFAFGRADLSLIDVGLQDTARRWVQMGTRLEAVDPIAASPPKQGEAHHPEPPVSELLEELYARRSTRPDPDTTARLLFVQDRANLIDVLTSVGSVATEKERLALVAAEHYPLRDFMIDHVVDGRFDVSQDHDTLPIAPRPGDGLRELAAMVLAEMTAGDGIPTADGTSQRGITRSRAIELFAALADRRLATVHRLSPTRLGIKRLLQMEFGGNFEVRVAPLLTAIAPPVRLGDHAPVDDDLVFVCANVEERSAAAASLVPLMKKGAGKVAPLGWVARDDLGLAHVFGSMIVIDDTAHQILDVADDRIEVEPTNDPASGNLGLDSSPRTVFCRLYDLDAAASTVVAASADTGGTTPTGTTIRYFRLFAPMRRLTHAKIVESSMAATASGNAVLPDALSSSAQVPRARTVGRSIVIRFERPAVAIVDEAARAEWETTVSRIAFTLQVTLADVLHSLFPRLAHRLAVLAPRAAPAFARLDRDPAAPAAHVAARYPRLTSLDAACRPVEDAEHADRLVLDLARHLDRSWLGAERSTGKIDAIDVIVLEDWSGDLGVCEAIASARGQIQRIWRAYLEWSTDQVERPDLFHRFGTTRLVDEFAFAAARDLLPPPT